jgi:Ribosomal proteins 50S-L15, 50S-L18e, 60S-L27A
VAYWCPSPNYTANWVERSRRTTVHTCTCTYSIVESRASGVRAQLGRISTFCLLVHQAMPPRLPQLLRWGSSLNAPPTPPITSFLLPFLQQRQSVSILSSLSDNPSAYNKRIRRGRGPSSGKGKTSGRGHKGQKQHGKVPRGFQGGQTPVEVVKGERGFTNKYVHPLRADNWSWDLGLSLLERRLTGSMYSQLFG